MGGTTYYGRYAPYEYDSYIKSQIIKIQNIRTMVYNIEQVRLKERTIEEIHAKKPHQKIQTPPTYLYITMNNGKGYSCYTKNPKKLMKDISSY